MRTVRVAIIGSRDYPWPENVRDCVQYLCAQPFQWTLISGGAVGVDTWAREAAQERNVPVVEIKPDWSLGKSAGMIRNREIVGRAETVIAFWDGKSPGTKNSIDLAQRLGKQVLVVGV